MLIVGVKQQWDRNRTSQALHFTHVRSCSDPRLTHTTVAELHYIAIVLSRRCLAVVGKHDLGNLNFPNKDNISTEVFHFSGSF